MKSARSDQFDRRDGQPRQDEDALGCPADMRFICLHSPAGGARCPARPFDALEGVIVLFVQIDTVRMKNPFCDKNLETRPFAPLRPFHADWYASA